MSIFGEGIDKGFIFFRICLTMKNIEISIIFKNIAKLLTIKGEASFRIKSYEKAADIISDLAEDVSELIEEGKFQSFSGIGKTIEDKSKEILDTGTCQAYEKLITEMGVEALDLLELRGIGGKTAGVLYNDLDIKNLNELSEAIDTGKLQGVKGIGKKTLETISDSLVFLKTYKGTRILARCLDVAAHLSTIIDSCESVNQFQFSGDLRRREEVCRSIEIVAECSDDIHTTKSELVDTFSTHEQPLQTIINDPQNYTAKIPILEPLEKIHLHVDKGFPVDIYLCSAEDFETLLFLTTPTTAHLDAIPNINDKSDSKGFLIESQNQTETEIYEKLGMSFIPPELRNYPDSVTLASENQLPELIDFNDLRGDLHTHTDWSDGAHSMEEMVEAAINRELDYYAITDHSVSSTVANGLDQQRLLAQIKYVRQLNNETEGITLLAGSEVDIRRDGSLDYSNEILAQLDIVVASVHSNFTQSETEMTKRVLKAIENPYVMIIGHPTGRLLGRRQGYPINLDEIIQAASENNTILEINGSPSRLDLGPEYVRQAKEAGVLIAVNTDAHSIPESERYKYGVNVARRSGLTKNDVINTYPLAQLRQVLKGNVS